MNPDEFPTTRSSASGRARTRTCMVATQFSNSASTAVMVVGFERDKMLACQTARMLYKNMFPIDPYLPFVLPADADGPTSAAGEHARADPGDELRRHGSRPRPAPGLERDARLDAHRRSTSPTSAASRRPRTTRTSATTPVTASRSPARPWASTRSPTASCTECSTGTSAAGRRSSPASPSTPAATTPACAGTRSRRSEPATGASRTRERLRRRCRQPLDAEHRDGQERQPRARLLRLE